MMEIGSVVEAGQLSNEKVGYDFSDLMLPSINRMTDLNKDCTKSCKLISCCAPQALNLTVLALVLINQNLPL